MYRLEGYVSRDRATGQESFATRGKEVGSRTLRGSKAGKGALRAWSAIAGCDESRRGFSNGLAGEEEEMDMLGGFNPQDVQKHLQGG